MLSMAQWIQLILAAVIVVPLCARLGLGSVLGYLAAGVLVGPWVLGIVDEVEHVLHFAEYGVVLLLFVIGLELRPSRLWALRKAIFGAGTMQLLGSGVLLAGFLFLMGAPGKTAAVAGVVLALSSTAFALQILAERKELTARWGRTAFGVLLFQDLAVVPLLALLPLLGTAGEQTAAPSLSQLGISLGALLLVVFGGRHALRFALGLASRSHVREILTATALLAAFGTAYLLEAAGLSMALGAFLAGVLLADSEFRHQLEADIEPFKGLLLGLFFIAVGMSLNLGLLASGPARIALLVIGLVGLKFLALYALGRFSGLESADARKLGIALSQGGEFAFVLFGAVQAGGLISTSEVQELVVAVSLSMVTTPLLFLLHDALSGRQAPAPDFDQIDEQEAPVIIVGFGRFGQIAARVLGALRVPFTALDASHQQVDFVRKYGNDIYYGDGSRLDLLEAAGAQRARFLVLAIDDPDTSVRAAGLIRAHFPNLQVFARARDRNHAYRLMDTGVTLIRRETFHSALALTRDLLLALGMTGSAADRTLAIFREHDERRLQAHAALHDDQERMTRLARDAARELEELFKEDAGDLLRLARERDQTDR
ncbi:monovalent cation:proton antiporter-2 (CPA2) family protein [Parahaliea aestuarii]|uniref:Glutathione-regulated potassium-efflux system protein KefB n=1 Tax=Parahaliea aestuarii TaxID=1852021 RepID=A0A5C8ZVB9_9GAMM|nr:monovalent cation:proton antiporter-2 (CPA2) family protein [Parahaliea aestuarii]TXS91211.1 glutathione-regulated potassium-efflux system protein KefB [Parahaliea aestuarii]